MTMRVATWNLGRKRPDSERGSEAIEYLFGLSPDVMALTEARTSFPLRGGHSLWCEPPHGSTFAANERKVLLWSKEPWTEVDRTGVEGLDQTRFVSATTTTSIGPIRVLGLCIPWEGVEVDYPVGVKRKRWDVHVEYLEILAGLIASIDMPTVVAGDFNQQIPKVDYGNRRAGESLAAAFAPMTIVTEGHLDGVDRSGLDHIAVSSHLAADRVWGWPHDVDGAALTDHTGAAADLQRSTP